MNLTKVNSGALELLIQYFEAIPVSHRTIILVGGLTFFLLLEAGIPLFKFHTSKLKHVALNGFFTLTTLIINLAGAFLILKAADFNTANQTGILNLFTLPLWIKVISGLLILDLIGAWLVHWVEHQVKWMWGFHVVHHTDQEVDVTSGLRHHPGESIFRLSFTALAVVISGASFGVVMLYQTLSGFFAHLTHANVKSHPWIEYIFSPIFVTPHFHKIHHHYTLPHTDSNYGNIFSIWDRIFGTVIHVNNMDKIIYGLDTHMSKKETWNISTILKIPFQKYRSPSGSKFSE